MATQLVELGLSDWMAAEPNGAWIAALEAGKVLVFPRLAFDLLPAERSLLTPALLSPKARNISLDAQGHLKGAVGDAEVQGATVAMVGRFRMQAQQLVQGLLPHYTPALRCAAPPRVTVLRRWKHVCSRGGRTTGVCTWMRFLPAPTMASVSCGCSPT